MEFLELLHEQSSPKWRNFAEIYPAPRRQWPTLVKHMIDKKWTIEDTRAEVSRFRPQARIRPMPPPRRISVAIFAVSRDAQGSDVERALATPAPDPRAVPCFWR
jgi:hypothetical protein